MTIIECQHLSKTYRHHKLLDSLTFSIEENTITGLIGRNGAGKTTSMRMMYLRLF
ncbi:MAG: ATP-binding cassette domain-containing protein [Tuberibacillus sp.]